MIFFKNENIGSLALNFVFLASTFLVMAFGIQNIQEKALEQYDQISTQSAQLKASENLNFLNRELSRLQISFKNQKDNILSFPFAEPSEKEIENYLSTFNGAVDSMVIKTTEGTFTLVYDENAGLIIKENRRPKAEESARRNQVGTFKFETTPPVVPVSPKLSPEMGETANPLAGHQIKIEDTYHQAESKHVLSSALYLNTNRFLTTLQGEITDTALAEVFIYDGENFTPSSKNKEIDVLEKSGNLIRALISTPGENPEEKILVLKDFDEAGLQLAFAYSPDEFPSIAENKPELTDYLLPLGISAALLLGFLAFSKIQAIRLQNLNLAKAKTLHDIATKLGVVLKDDELFIYQTNPNGELIFVSENVDRVLGYDEKELLNNKSFPLSDTEWNKLAFFGQMTPGKAKSEQNFKVDMTRKDGEILLLEMREEPYRNPDGVVEGKIGFAKNITEKSTLEASLQESKALKDAILSAFPESLLVLNRKGIIQEFKEHGYHPIHLKNIPEKGESFFSLFPVQLQSELSSAFDYTVLTGMQRTIEFKQLEQGRPKHYELKTLMVNPDRYVILFKDITEDIKLRENLKKANLTAEDANLAKNMFLATISHEIRTPLNGIIGLSTLLEESGLKAEQQDLLASLKLSATNLNHIVSDILNFSKIDSGQVQLERRDFDVQVLVNSIIEDFNPKAVRKGLSLSYDLDASIPQSLIGDPEKIRQVLSHILSNALKFTENGYIHLSIQLESLGPGQKVVLKCAVRDSGIGIPEENSHFLFQPFTQVDTTNTRKFGGTGLGLAICQKLVRMMKGEIGVESKLGEGSEFFFTIQLRSEHIPIEGKLNRISQMRVLPAEKKNLNLWLLDENPITRITLEANLKNMGHSVFSGQQELEIDPDIILVNAKISDLKLIGDLNQTISSRKNGKPCLVSFSFENGTINPAANGLRFDKSIHLSHKGDQLKEALQTCINSIQLHS